MSRSKPPRRKYRGAQNLAAERMAMIRRFGASADSSLLLSVTPDAAGHPVARAVERTLIHASGDSLELIVLAAEDGAHNPQMLDECIQFVALAMFASEGYELPEETQALFLAAIDALTIMGKSGCIWREQYRALVAEAVATAAPMFAALPPEDRNRAAFTLRRLDKLADAAARAAA